MAEKLYKSIRLISYGLFVVCSKKGKKYNGLIVNTVFQVTSKPQKIAVSIAKDNFTHEYITKSKVLTASVLAKETPMQFIGRFGFKSGKDYDKFQEELNYKFGITEVPIILDYALGYLEGKVINSVDCGTHTLFIAEVCGGEILREGEPLTYAYYREKKHGKAPKNAPTYFEELIKTNPKGEIE